MLKHESDEEIERNRPECARKIPTKMLHNGEENENELEIVGTECERNKFETGNNEMKRNRCVGFPPGPKTEKKVKLNDENGVVRNEEL